MDDRFYSALLGLMRTIFLLFLTIILGHLVYDCSTGQLPFSEYEYKQEVVIGTVVDRDKDLVLASAKPVVYTTRYQTDVELADGQRVTLSGSSVYYACEIGDVILVEIEYKYADGELVGTTYTTVESKSE